MALLSTQYRTVVSIYVNLFLLLVGIGSKTNFVVLPNPAWRHILPADLRFITCFFPHSNGSWKHSCPDGFTANHCACLYPACSHIFCIFLMFITTFFWSFNTKHIVFVSLNFHSYPCCWVNKTTNDLQGFEWLRQRCAHRLILRLQTWTLGRWSTSGLQRNSDLWVWQCSISHPVFHQTLWTIIISYVNAPL